MARQAYNTRQREIVLSLMARNADSYLTVDSVCRLLAEEGSGVGRTTVYRTLERLVSEGKMSKVPGIRGEAAQYRALAPEAPVGSMGQMRCVRCGRVYPLDCQMLESFAKHVLQEHGFAIDQRKTVIYGLCPACRAEARDGGGESRA